MRNDLTSLIAHHVRRMVGALGSHEKGNIHPLIMSEVERILLETALTQTENNYVKAARILGIGRARLYRLVKKLELEGRK